MTKKQLFARYLMTSAAVAAMMLPAAAAMGQAQVSAKLDSAYLLMGKQTTIRIESVIAAAKGDVKLLVPDDTLVTNVEVVGATVADSTVTNGVLSMHHNVTIQSFDSGLYTIPPFRMLVGNDTVLSNHTVLKVLPVPVDTLQGRIHDYADVAEPEHKLFDFIPQSVYQWIWWVLLALVLIAAGILTYIYVIKKKVITLHPAPKPVPPYEEAINALTALRQEKLCEKGHEREFYTRLTDILRNYLYRRFNIAAMEMTTTEILRTLGNNSETRMTRRQMEDILAMADFVKFAKMRPLPDDNVRTYNQAVNFVESTRPQPEPEATDKEPETKNKQ